MGVIATTVEKQIEIFENRGLELDLGNEKVKEILLDIGYYRLGFYWNPFQIDSNHNFEEGAKFSNVLALYYLDVDLKNILIKALNRIEINIRTKIVYHVSNNYPENSTWFASKRIMNTRFVDSLPDYYNDNFKKNNVPIKKHHQKYENDIYAPAWKTLEFLTFGTVFRIYQELKEENLKIKIANEYGIKKVKVFENFVRTIIFIRNICAHSGVLFDSNTPKEIATTPLIRFNNNNRHSLDSSIKVILYFMGYISENRKIEMKIELENLYQQFEDNSVINKIITEKIGFIK